MAKKRLFFKIPAIEISEIKSDADKLIRGVRDVEENLIVKRRKKQNGNGRE